MSLSKGAFYTGQYRNVLKEYGYCEEEINERIRDTWNQMFYGDDNTRIYHLVGDNEGYMVDTGNNDVRTEGMSYGMMMCVQMDKKEEFDRIWTWTKKYMWQESGEYAGYFAWSANLDGSKRYQGPAPDGEEYFAMALLFAANRWGEGLAPYDYSHQAKEILKVCVHKGEDGIGNPMWDPENKLIKFIPESPYSDPSYHLPHFYDLFALWAYPEDRKFWSEAAAASREYLKLSCHPVTGLAPEYARYDGTPEVARGHQHFYSDAYRVAGNIGLDYEWFRGDEWERGEADRLQSFFTKLPVPKDYRMYTVEGVALEEKALHPVGLLAMNAMASLATTGPSSKECIKEFWNTPLRTGVRRYYDNCLYFFSLLALSGNYRIFKERRF